MVLSRKHIHADSIEASSSTEDDSTGTEISADAPEETETVVPSGSFHPPSPRPGSHTSFFTRSIFSTYLGWSQSKYSSPASRRPESTPSTRNPPFCRLLTSTTALPAETAAHTVTILCVNTAPLPIHRFGAPVAYDVDGRTPLYLGTAHAAFGGLHPCRVQPGVLWPAAYVAHAGLEHGHGGRVDVLVIDTHAMEWVPARDGEVPRGWRPIVGGCEADGRVLFYAIAPIEKVWIPGKTGRHLPGACVPSGGKEQIVREGYKILCWRG